MALYSTKSANYNNQKLGNYQGADYTFFSNTAFSADVLQNYLRSQMTVTDQAISGSVLANSLFSPAYGTHYYSAPTGQSLCSMYLPVPSEGMVLMLNGINLVGDANVKVSLATGAAMKRPSGSACSSINLSAAAWAALLCEADGTWTVIEANASATVQVA